MDRHDSSIERDLADALRRLKAAAGVAPTDPRREAALLAAFDAVHSRSAAPRRRDPWYLAAFAAAAAVLLAVGLAHAPAGRQFLPGGSTAAHRPPPSSAVQ